MSANSDSEQKVLNDIEEYGWHVICVTEDESGPGFGYSIGLHKTFGHSEILIVGLKLDLIHSIINNIGEEIKKGKAFREGIFYSDLIERFDCYFNPVKLEYYDEYVGYANWYYKGSEFPLMQCIYPTVKGIYPWENGWPVTIKNLQPILGDVNRDLI